MSESTAFKGSHIWSVIKESLQLLGGVLAIGGGIAIFCGWLVTGQTNSHDVTRIQTQIDALSTSTTTQFNSLSSQMSSMASRVEEGPRADDLKVLDRHLSSIDGRLDAYDTRLRSVEAQQAATAATIQGIDAASRAQLRR